MGDWLSAFHGTWVGDTKTESNRRRCTVAMRSKQLCYILRYIIFLAPGSSSTLVDVVFAELHQEVSSPTGRARRNRAHDNHANR